MSLVWCLLNVHDLAHVEHISMMDYESIMYAYRDQARLYRRLRRDVMNGVIDHYTIDECTDKINEANVLAEKYELMCDSWETGTRALTGVLRPVIL